MTEKKRQIVEVGPNFSLTENDSFVAFAYSVLGYEKDEVDLYYVEKDGILEFKIVMDNDMAGENVEYFVIRSCDLNLDTVNFQVRGGVLLVSIEKIKRDWQEVKKAA